MIKANKHGTVNRGTLMKLIAVGGIEAKCKYRYTDDYWWDNESDFGRTDWLRAVIDDNSGASNGCARFTKDDFDSETGKAWLNKDGTVTLKVHGNESWTLRAKPEGVNED